MSVGISLLILVDGISLMSFPKMKITKIDNEDIFLVDNIEEVKTLQDLPPIPEEYFLIVKGSGSGHGVGMSQWGAKAMAESGSSFHQILKHYYSGVQIKHY